MKRAHIKQRNWIWISWGFTAVLIIAGLYYIWQRVDLREMGRILSQVQLVYVALTAVILLLTLFVKTWRWQILLISNPGQENSNGLGDGRPAFAPLFWALMLGQYVNLLVPVLRLGEVARIFAVSNATAVGKSRALGTLAVEKFMDLALLGLTMALALTAVVAPAVAKESAGGMTVFIAGLAVVGLAILYGVARNPHPVIRLTQKTAVALPPRIGNKIVHIIESGLEGLTSLADRRLLLAILSATAVVAILSVLTPYALFFAFPIPLGIFEAAWLHIVITLALVPPSSPGKLVILDGAVIVVLKQYRLTNEALLVGYALLFHLILVLPQIILGSIASARMGWQWKTKPEGTQL
ncbi:MAG: flippase-like domain-containing protein [Chloroflexi bacterium]|nr:flippase-like domain-containing protein [Chloroflexota bacterium]